MIIINICETGHGNTLFRDGYLTGILFRSDMSWVHHGIEQIEEALNKGKVQRYSDLLRNWGLEQANTKLPYLADLLYWDPSKMCRDLNGQICIEYTYGITITDSQEPCISIIMLSRPNTGVCKKEERLFMVGSDIIEFGRLLEKYDLEHCKVCYIEYDEDSTGFSYVQLYLENHMPEVVVSFHWNEDALCFRPDAIRSFPDVYTEVHYPDFNPELKRALKLKHPKLIADLYND